MITRRRSFALAIGVCAYQAAGGVNCAPEWTSGFAVPGIEGSVSAAITFNNELYIGGTFRRADGTMCNGIAKWNGSTFEPLGRGLTFSQSGDPSGTSGTVHSLAVFDPDGPGSAPAALYAGGAFRYAVAADGSRVFSPNLVKWNGTEWEEVNADLTGVGIPPYLAGGEALALLPFDDGVTRRLYVAGNFEEGVQWTTDGTNFTSFADDQVIGEQEYVTSLVTFDADGPGGNPAAVYFGGSNIGLARIDGNNYVEIAGVPGGLVIVQALETYDPDGPGSQPNLLYIARGLSIYTWNGATFSNFPVSFNQINQNDASPYSQIETLKAADLGSGPKLYIGGMFSVTPPAGQSQNAYSSILTWNGTNFSSLGSGLTDVNTGTADTRHVVAVSPCTLRGQPVLLVGGSNFQGGGGVGALNLGFWNDASWQPLRTTEQRGLSGNVAAPNIVDLDGTGPQPARMTLVGPAVAGNIVIDGGSVAQLINGQWTVASVPSPGAILDGIDWRLVNYDDGSGASLYAYTASGSLSLNPVQRPLRLARYLNGVWQLIPGTLGEGVINAVTVYDPDGQGGDQPWLVFGGSQGVGGTIDFPGVVAWDGSSWLQLDSGFTNEVDDSVLSVRSLLVFNDGSGEKLYAGGILSSSFLSPVDALARFNGTSWEVIGSINGGSISSMTIADLGSGDALFVGGGFTNISGTAANRVARWTGSGWAALGTGIPNTPIAQQLTVGSALVVSLAGFDDGDGEALYVAGRFVNAGGVSVSHLAKWNGSSWSNVGGGVKASGTLVPVTTMIVNDDDHAGPSMPSLYVFGPLDNAGGINSQHIARWGCPPVAACPADFNGDSVRDVADLFAYINAWLAKTSSADFNSDTTVDVADLFAYINAWLAGC